MKPLCFKRYFWEITESSLFHMAESTPISAPIKDAWAASTLKQHWVNVSCLLELCLVATTIMRSDWPECCASVMEKYTHITPTYTFQSRPNVEPTSGAGCNAGPVLKEHLFSTSRVRRDMTKAIAITMQICRVHALSTVSFAKLKGSICSLYK